MRRRPARRTARRTTRRTARRVMRRRRRRRILVGGFVLLAVGGATYGAVKLSQKDAQRIEQHTETSVEELSDEELVAAMKELGIQSIELDENDKVTISKEADQVQPAPSATPAPPTESESSYLDELERLAALRDQGAISDEEFEAKKKQLLGL